MKYELYIQASTEEELFEKIKEYFRKKGIPYFINKKENLVGPQVKKMRRYTILKEYLERNIKTNRTVLTQRQIVQETGISRDCIVKHLPRITEELIKKYGISKVMNLIFPAQKITKKKILRAK